MRAMPLTYSIARARREVARFALLCMVLLGGSCGRDSSQDSDAPGPRPARIVSLSPAITECAVELGLADRIVGRTPWCEAVAPEVPVVGTLLDVDAEALVRSSPTMVLVQPPAQGIDPALEGLAARHGWTMHAWRISGLDDARAAMAGIADAVAEADPTLDGGVRARHAAWCAMLDAALVPLPESAELRGTSVLVTAGGLEGVAFGAGTYIDDALVRLGVRNALGRPGYPALSAEDVVRIAPGAIIVIGGPGTASALPTIEGLSARVIRLPSDGLAVPGGRLPHGLKALRNALVRKEAP